MLDFFLSRVESEWSEAEIKIIQTEREKKRNVFVQTMRLIYIHIYVSIESWAGSIELQVVVRVLLLRLQVRAAAAFSRNIACLIFNAMNTAVADPISNWCFLPLCKWQIENLAGGIRCRRTLCNTKSRHFTVQRIKCSQTYTCSAVVCERFHIFFDSIVVHACNLRYTHFILTLIAKLFNLLIDCGYTNSTIWHVTNRL